MAWRTLTLECYLISVTFMQVDLIREHGPPGSLQILEGGDLPHQRAWLSKFPSGGGGKELTSSESMVLQVPFRWWRKGTYLIREHGCPSSLQVVEERNLPHQRAWLSKFPSGGGGKELTSSESMVLQVPFRWWRKGTYLIREHGSPGSFQVVVGVDDEGRDVEGVAGRDPEAGNVQLCLGVVHELGHDEGSAVGVHRAVQVREPVPLYT